MKKRISRRDLLKLLAASAGAGIVGCSSRVRQTLLGRAQDLENRQFLPWLGKGETAATPTPEPPSTPLPPPTGARVVHVHDVDATNWNISDPLYWKYVNQAALYNMVDQGVMALTGMPTAADSWRALIPSYQAGQKVAIKVSFNNGNSCDDIDNQIDAVAEPINAIVSGLKLIGIPENDICIYEARNRIPDRFVERLAFENLCLYDTGCRTMVSWNSDDSYASVTFTPPAGTSISPIRLPDLLIEADYLINVPIIKRHSGAGVSLSFKNHFGTIQRPYDLHPYVYVGLDTYNSAYSPMIDIYKNPHVGAKTVLTVADGLFGAPAQGRPPELWSSFDQKSPNSLFFALDPVAVDCVMCDFLEAEWGIWERSDDYLKLASVNGLGVYERGEPWGSGYSQIDYHKVEL